MLPSTVIPSSRHPVIPSSRHPVIPSTFPLAVGLCLVLAGCASPSQRVVVYSAQDEEFATNLLDDFTHRTGVEVAPRYDTEKNKTVSLFQELVNEHERPRCDLFWNNEILNTILLQRQGLLQPYASGAAEAFPEQDRAKDHTWTAFAARARVLIVNTKIVPKAKWPTSILDLTKPRWKDKAAIAKPLFGTTATQGACLFEVLGPDRAVQYYRGLKANGIHVVGGNKDVADGVSAGQYAVGMTDTDDAIGEVERGEPVAIIFPDRDAPKGDRMGTLFIPNTLAIIGGCPNPAGARKLVDYLLSPEVEGRLAEAASHQIPLNPEVKAKLPPEILRPEQVKTMDVDWEKAADRWPEARRFFNREFTAP
jgi:iron(III) transport system substrate-binding protein